MFDSTLDLFTNNDEVDDKQHMIDMMRDTYWDRMNKLVDDKCEFDAIACFEEWVVNGEDPEDGKYKFIFVPDITE
jgi:hypothetical protein